MNWKLIFLLSLFGFGMAIATVIAIPSNIEPIFWLVIFLVCAYVIAKKSPGKHFLHGFMTAIFNSIWVTSFHLIFYSTYITHHPQMQTMVPQMPLQGHPRLLMLITGPVIGIISGLVLGLFAFIAGKIFKKDMPSS